LHRAILESKKHRGMDEGMKEQQFARRVEEVGDAIAMSAARVNKATHQMIHDMVELDDRGGWADAGASSMVSWCSWRMGMSRSAAYEHLRVGRALADLPEIDRPMAEGLLSYSKVRALTRVARPENQEVMLNIGRAASAAQLERICRGVRRIEAGARDGAPEAERWVSSRPAADGNVEIVMRLRPEEAAMVMKAIESSAEGGDKADGAVAMAESVLRGGSERSPAEIVVHIDADTLEGSTELGDGLPVETCKRLLCDAGVVPMLESGGRIIDAGRKSRLVSSALKRALVSRDGGCRFPGCDHRLVDAHHIEHWVHGGETVQENLLLLMPPPSCGGARGRLHHRGRSVRWARVPRRQRGGDRSGAAASVAGAQRAGRAVEPGRHRRQPGPVRLRLRCPEVCNRWSRPAPGQVMQRLPGERRS
jgi:hypothetical protein